MTRTTRSQLDSMLAILAKHLDKPVGFGPGALSLESWAPGDGRVRYRIVLGLEGGGETAPFGHAYLYAGELWSAIHFALGVLDHVSKAPTSEPHS